MNSDGARIVKSMIATLSTYGTSQKRKRTRMVDIYAQAPVKGNAGRIVQDLFRVTLTGDGFCVTIAVREQDRESTAGVFEYIAKSLREGVVNG